jgi:predicted DCC family thiol-disulfide oxidoreductase YuxK
MQVPVHGPRPEFPDRLLFFDGVCNLCNGLVQFIIRHDAHGRFRFAALQSETGQRFLHLHGRTSQNLDSLVYWRNGRVLTRSTAALNVARDLGGFWPLAYGLIMVPRFIRDAAYDLIARKRYRWFGRRETCMVPTPELRERFPG